MSIKNLRSSAALLMWPRGLFSCRRSGKWSGISPIGRVQSAFLPEMRIARRRQEFRWTVWRWAFVFIGRGRWKERDRGFVVWGGTAPIGGQGSRLHEGNDLSALNLKPKE